jgi:hypothetical protein
MAKNSVDEWSTVVADNTDIGSIGIQGTSPPSNFDNAFRTMMAQVRTKFDSLAVANIMPGYLHGLTLSNNATDATNDIDIATGYAASNDTTTRMVLASAITKRLDAAWAVGTGNGGLDTGTVADQTYHVYLIHRPDTSVTDVIFSASPTAPTLPTNYTKYRRIGSIIFSASAILPFYQIGDRFLYKSEITDRSSTAAASNAALTMSVPTGLVVQPIFRHVQQQGTAGQASASYADGVTGSIARAVCITNAASEYENIPVDGFFSTNTSGQLSITVNIPSGTLSVGLTITQGYIDRRGRDA